MPWLGADLAPVAGAIIVALISAAGTGFLAWRKLSGKITTTTADRLWEEATSLRAEYRKDADTLRAELEECRVRIDKLEADNKHLHEENGLLVRRVEELTRENERLRLRVKELEVNGV